MTSSQPETLYQRIRRHEGCNLIPYKDTEGFWTIGWGHRLKSDEYFKYREGITQAQADNIFEEDLAHAVRLASAGLRCYQSLCKPRQDVLSEMVFQLGYLAVCKFKNVLLALDLREYNKAADEMLNSLWHKQTPARCEELAAIMRKGA